MINLQQELTLLQQLYEGSPLDMSPGDESFQCNAMELNTHLISAADFGKYSNAEKINLLYQLRRAVEIIYRQHFSQSHGG
jgi:hypothetical protein